MENEWVFPRAELRARRLAAGLNRRQVADRVGCHDSEIFQLESGRLRGDWVWVEQITEAIEALVREREEAKRGDLVATGAE